MIREIQYSKVYCQIHRIPLIHLREIDNDGDRIEVGYCCKCKREYCEYKDVNSIYISNYEWLYGDGRDEI